MYTARCFLILSYLLCIFFNVIKLDTQKLSFVVAHHLNFLIYDLPSTLITSLWFLWFFLVAASVFVGGCAKLNNLRMFLLSQVSNESFWPKNFFPINILLVSLFSPLV